MYKNVYPYSDTGSGYTNGSKISFSRAITKMKCDGNNFILSSGGSISTYY